MRIALVTPGFSADERDWCIPALLNLVRALAREHDVQVFTLRYPHVRETYNVYGATVHAFAGAETRGAGRIALLLKAIRAIRREHRVAPFDVIHAFWADEPGFVATTCGRLMGVPTVVSVMGGELVSLPDIQYGGQLGRLNRWFTRLALRGASCITVGSDYLEQVGQGYVSEKKTRRLPLGVDRGLFSPCDQAGAQGRAPLQGKPAILSVGSLVPVKDHALLLRSLPRIVTGFPEVHLHLVGDGSMRRDLAQLTESLDLTGHVTFHGEIPHDRLPPYYRAADLLVVSSRHESQCMVALEAAACGCPVIGTAVGVLPEISPASAVISPGDPDALASGIMSVIGDAATLVQLRDSAMELVHDGYGLDRTIPALLALYAELVASR